VVAGKMIEALLTKGRMKGKNMGAEDPFLALKEEPEKLKAQTLIEALPYIRAFYDQTVVIKYGGHAMADERLKRSFALNVTLLRYVGINPVIVHGGGPQIGKVLERMHIETSFVQGMRVTDKPTMDVVEMVLVGGINKEIVHLINNCGGNAVGLSGKDGHLIRASKLHLYKNRGLHQPPEIIDIGMVGQVEEVNPAVLHALERDRFIPVIAPVGAGSEGETYNINADLVAGKVAAALKAQKLILLTDVAGVMGPDGKLIMTLTAGEARKMIEAGEIKGGMIPKVNCCLDALEGGVSKAHIIDGRRENAVLLEILTDKGLGTEITLD
jgi:acetylglutamate kinase